MTRGSRKSASRIAIAAAAGLFISLAPAQAADLDGDCCEDLEERVAALEKTVVRKGNRKVTIKLSGNVNEMVMYWDDGVETDLYQVNNHHKRSRWHLSGSAKITNHLTAGYKQVFFINAPTSRTVTQRDDDGGFAGDSGFNTPKHFWYLKHKHLGKLSVGRNSSATDDLARIDLGGANGIAGAETFNAGGFLFLTRGNVNATGGGSQARRIITPIDIARTNNVRYDTPNLFGFVLTTAWGEDDIWDVAVRFAGEFGGIRIAAGAGYYETTDNRGQSNVGGTPAVDDEGDSRYLGSVSIWDAANTGLYTTGFWNVGDDGGITAGVKDNADEVRWGIRAGIRQNFLGIGKTNIFVDYQKAEVDNRVIEVDTSPTTSLQFFGDHEGEQWGVGLVQDIDVAAMSLYVRYKRWSFDVRGTDGVTAGVNGNINDINIAFAGGIINF